MELMMLLILHLLYLPPASTRDTCYFPDGTITTDFPCRQGGNGACCGAGCACMSNNLCMYSNYVPDFASGVTRTFEQAVRIERGRIQTVRAFASRPRTGTRAMTFRT
ncbi:hypothetical protein EJ06DRAFT_23136 [Trichodelitschia bisporula]|uniref:Uncharacterized protein n=1 Tax=Trichodelitschia bisporula TaxID=703511 RepID=A0A6G1IAY7_9PEZI|nr:hypothetical protein EJ06DRAFT_23136 [Trichodelitschia bisporula]